MSPPTTPAVAHYTERIPTRCDGLQISLMSTDRTNAASPLAQSRRVVVKVGSALLVNAASGQLNHEWLATLATDIAYLRSRGQDVLLVSSGAIEPDVAQARAAEESDGSTAGGSGPDSSPSEAGSSPAPTGGDEAYCAEVDEIVAEVEDQQHEFAEIPEEDTLQ